MEAGRLVREAIVLKNDDNGSMLGATIDMNDAEGRFRIYVGGRTNCMYFSLHTEHKCNTRKMVIS